MTKNTLYHQRGLASKFLSLLPSTLWTVKGHPSWILHLLLTYGARLNRWTLQGLSWDQLVSPLTAKASITKEAQKLALPFYGAQKGTSSHQCTEKNYSSFWRPPESSCLTYTTALG